MRYTIEDVFEVSPGYYWETFFSKEFNTALWAALDVGWEQQQLDVDLLRIVQVQKLTPRRELPSFVQPFVTGQLSYVERNVLTVPTNVMTSETIPSFMADKITANGVYRLEVLASRRVKRVWEGNVECDVFLVGGKIERMLVEEIQDSYKKATAFMRQWYAEHPEPDQAA